MADPSQAATVISVELTQDGKTTSSGTARSHRVLVDRPEAKGGADKGPMGGELMLLGLGGCFMSNLLAAICVRDAPVSDVRTTVHGTLADRPKRFASFALDVRARCDDQKLLEKLVIMAERECISANTIKQGAEMTVTVTAES